MFTFKDPEKIRELARHGEAWRALEDRQLLGGVYLRLSPGQYAALRSS
jgi:hypothetical protein